MDPFIGIKPASNSFASLTFQVILMVFDLFLLRYFIIVVKRKKTLIDLDFHLLLWIFSGVYTFAVFASGGYSGRTLDFQIDQSGHQATQFDVVVNSPTKPAVLMLGAYEPSIWNISWTPKTKIVEKRNSQ